MSSFTNFMHYFSAFIRYVIFYFYFNFQVQEFLSATKEIVILDFHNFPRGFKNDAIHQKLMEMIIRKFKSYIIPYNEDYTYAKFR